MADRSASSISLGNCGLKVCMTPGHWRFTASSTQSSPVSTNVLVTHPMVCTKPLGGSLGAGKNPVPSDPPKGLRGAGTIICTKLRQEYFKHEVRECSSSPDESC